MESLEGQGLTRKRAAVLEAVRESHQHLNAAEIWEQARQREPRISYATVYNALHYLCTAGLLVEVPFGDGASLYDARTDRHEHALCTQCGQMVDFECDAAAEAAAEHARRTGFVPTDVHITVSGLCPACQPSPTAGVLRAPHGTH